MENDHRTELDRILDDALGCYSEAAQPPTLEERILARVNRVPGGRRWRRLYVALAVAAALVLAIAGVWTQQPRSVTDRKVASRVPDTKAQIHPELTRPEFQKPPVRPVRHTVHGKPRPHERRIQVIPPLTGEERALLVLAEHRAADVPSPVGEVWEPNIRPIEIQAIEIKPLQSDGTQ
jgi:hypothetical protein